MCGIAGLIDSSNTAAHHLPRVSTMTTALRHRGPDDEGVELVNGENPAAILGHRRLSIIDLSPAGHQPMHDVATGNWITFNGEIYNYRELRAQLETTGSTFTTKTDTEVILKAFAAWGTASFAQLRGIFALAIWDARERTLLLVRDQLGVKPLYYWHAGGQLLFASEVRALLISGLIPRRLDLGTLHSYFAYGSVQEPSTLVDGVHSLLPGHFLKFRNDRVSIASYWKFPDSDATQRNIQADVEVETRERLAEAVKLQLVSDVPLGAFLSGGIDSTAIAALAQRAAARPLKTFSVVFGEKQYDERDYSRRAAAYIGTEHTELDLTGDMVRTALPAAIDAFDQPSVDGLNTYFVSQVTRQAGLTVALSGVGGDELFGGYGGFRKALLFEKWGKRLSLVPRSLRPVVSALLNRATGSESVRQLARVSRDPDHTYFLTRQVFDRLQISNFLKETADNPTVSARLEQLSRQTDGYDLINRTSALELQTYMLSTLLRDTDQMSMAHALEIRVPLIDHKLVEFVFSLPGKCKIDNVIPKPLLTRALNGALPAECVNRPKRGFELPFAVWLRASLEKEVRETLTDPAITRLAPFDRQGIAKLWNDFQANRLGWSRVWGVFMLIRWLERHRVALG